MSWQTLVLSHLSIHRQVFSWLISICAYEYPPIVTESELASIGEENQSENAVKITKLIAIIYFMRTPLAPSLPLLTGFEAGYLTIVYCLLNVSGAFFTRLFH